MKTNPLRLGMNTLSLFTKMKHVTFRSFHTQTPKTLNNYKHINIINLAQGHRRQKLCEKIEKIALKIFLTFL